MDLIIPVITEGLIFAIFSFAIYLSFQWLKFPDLTPDGSFIIGSCVYIKFVEIGCSTSISFLIAFFAGCFCGFSTGFINRYVKIPSVIAGLLMSVALYSVAWVILGKPNQFLENSKSLLGDMPTLEYNTYLFLIVLIFTLFSIFVLNIFSNSIWGIRIRAIGENPKIAKNLNIKESFYYYILLAVSNGLVAVSGVFFLQRSFSADVNMGIGQTIIGLVSMLAGLIFASDNRKVVFILSMITLGAVLYKAIIFGILILGLPAELFRVTSAFALILLFLVMKANKVNYLKKLKWN
jgi:putative ABC transport system permease protein